VVQTPVQTSPNESVMPPKKTIWKLDRHSAAKHYLLRRYLQAWLPIMSSWQGRLVLIDGFAGPGVYKDGQPGSPIIMLNAFLEHDARDRIDAELVYVFIEQDKRRAARLESEIEKLGKLPSNVTVQVIAEPYEDAFSDVLDDIEQRGAKLAPTFAFLDPFGYSDAPMTLTGRFLQFDRCEVLVYVPLRTVNRWLRREGQERAMTNLFGTERWAKAVAIENGRERIDFLHDLFYDQLKSECGLSYVRSFEIITAARNSGYNLFFGTNHELGLLKMKELMWDVDPVRGRRFKDSTKSQMPVLFEPEPDIDPLRKALRAHFGKEPFSIDDAEKFALIETPYLPRHLKKPILKPLEAKEKLEVVTAKKGRRRGTFPSGTTVRFV
jgi:three-Cys-motif partner protein